MKKKKLKKPHKHTVGIWDTNTYKLIAYPLPNGGYSFRKVPKQS